MALQYLDRYEGAEMNVKSVANGTQTAAGMVFGTKRDIS